MPLSWKQVCLVRRCPPLREVFSSFLLDREYLSIHGSHRRLHPLNISVKIPETNRPKYSHSKRPRTDRHRPQQRRSNPFPKPPKPLPSIRLPETVPHIHILPIRPKPITLHLALHNIKRITPQPQRFARQPSIRCHLPLADLISIDIIALRIRLHHPLKS